MTIDVLVLGVISGLRPATSQAAVVALLRLSDPRRRLLFFVVAGFASEHGLRPCSDAQPATTKNSSLRRGSDSRSNATTAAWLVAGRRPLITPSTSTSMVMPALL